MRNLSDVTDTEIKAAYDSTPAINKVVPWAEVKASSVFVMLLKNQIIAHEDQPMDTKPESSRLFLAIDNRTKKPECIAAENATQKAHTITPEQQPEKLKRRSTITLHERQINQLISALSLARNCLQCGHVNDNLKSEALQELTASQKIIKSFYERT